MKRRLSFSCFLAMMALGLISPRVEAGPEHAELERGQVAEAARHVAAAREFEGESRITAYTRALRLYDRARRGLEARLEGVGSDKAISGDERRELSGLLQEVNRELFWCWKTLPIAVLPESERVNEGAALLEEARSFERSQRSSKGDRKAALERYRRAESTAEEPTLIAGLRRSIARLEAELSTATQPDAEADLSKAQLRALGELAKTYADSRRKLVCKSCKGQHIVPCRGCRGRGWKIRRYNNIDKVDWNNSRACSKCNRGGLKPGVRQGGELDPEPRNEPGYGRQRCRRSSCLFGFDHRAFEAVFWASRDPRWKLTMEREFQGPEGRGPLELMAFSLNGELRARHPIVSATFASALGFEGERRERLEAFVKQLGAPPSDQLVSSWHRVRQEVSAERRLRIELVRNKVGSDAARSSASSGLCRAPGSSRAAREAARVGGE